MAGLSCLQVTDYNTPKIAKKAQKAQNQWKMAKMLIFSNITAVAPPPGQKELWDPKWAARGPRPCSPFWGSEPVRATPICYECNIGKQGGTPAHNPL